MSLSLYEPDVALTDFMLTGATLVFFWRLQKLGQPAPGGAPLARAAGAFWLALSVSALLGGLYHGFLPDMPPAAAIPLWKAVMLMVGWGNVYLFHMALGFWHWKLGEIRRARLVKFLVWAFYLLYAMAILWVSSCYSLAIAFNIPAICTMVAVLGWLAFMPGSRHIGFKGLLAMALTVLAALLQLLKVDCPPLGLTYNAVYHLVTLLGLVFLHQAVCMAVSKPGPGEPPSVADGA